MSQFIGDIKELVKKSPKLSVIRSGPHFAALLQNSYNKNPRKIQTSHQALFSTDSSFEKQSVKTSLNETLIMQPPDSRSLVLIIICCLGEKFRMLDPAARPTISNEKIPQIPPVPSVNKMFQKLSPLSQRKKHYTTPVWVFNYRREGIINIEQLWALKIIWGLKMLFELRVFSFFRNHLWMCRVQTPRMLVWWIAGGKCPEMMKIVGIPHIPGILGNIVNNPYYQLRAHLNVKRC